MNQKEIIEKAVRDGIDYFFDRDSNEQLHNNLVSDITHCVNVALNRAMPPDNGLGDPKRTFDETFSAVALFNKFFGGKK